MALQKVESNESGIERWEETDGSAMEFRAHDGTKVRFATFSGRENLWTTDKIGTKITTSGRNFDYANVTSKYYLPSVGQLYAAYMDSDGDSNDSYLDEYEWSIVGEMPDRVESLCRVQWHGTRLKGIVQRGPDVATGGFDPQFPEGWPEDWPAIGAMYISPRSLTMNSRGVGKTVRSSVTISASLAMVKVRVRGANGAAFKVGTGEFQIAPTKTHDVGVEFTPLDKKDVEGTFDIEGPNETVTVRLRGKVVDVPVVRSR
ncbi:hypothetical protein [Conyzicola sp.]|uniref:hypothetical protein n=1 Tax=Conyzicola sp. TaxID=1969404 RepID=UPI00398A0D28